MPSAIIGTAGHIDHGKTALVKALTGIDPDRLEEEKRRGITIDIGFAHLDLTTPSGEPLRLGFVDVPGHERFVRNMLAGVGGIDVVMLVIAADEGIKPQTREHFDICRLLGIPRGITVLTKSDLVEPDALAVVRLEVAEFIRGSFLDGAPIVAVSSATGAGLDQLKHELANAAAQVRAKSADALCRLPIDRVFGMKGFGTVVTGTLISGAITKETEVEALPGGLRARVRGVQVHGEAAAQAVAGQRTALNLANLSREQLSRGMVLVEPGTLAASRAIDAEIELLPGIKPLRDRTRVHLHAYTAETVAEIVLLGAKEIQPGGRGLVHMRLQDLIQLAPGDRFVLRQFSPLLTIGGGRVLDTAPLEMRRMKVTAGARTRFLSALQQASPGEALLARIARRGPAGLSLSAAVAEMALRPADIQQLADELIAASHIIRAGDTLLATDSFHHATAQMKRELETFHDRNPLVAAMGREELRERLALSPAVFHRLLDDAARAGTVDASGEQVRLAGRGVTMRDEEADAKDTIETAFREAGLKVPAMKEVLAKLPLDRYRAQKLVTLLLRDRVLVKVSQDLVFHSSALDQLRRSLAAYKQTAPSLDVARFKALTGVSRKYAIPLLEYLDRERVTRRVGDQRVILG